MALKKEVEIKASIKLNGDTWDLFLANRTEVVNNCIRMFKEEGATEIKLKGILKKEGNRKSQKKMGYFYVEVLPKVSYGLKDLGYFEMDNDGAEYYLRQKFLGSKDYVNVKTGDVISEPRHLSELDDEEMRIFLDQVIKHASIDLMVRIKSSEEHKEEQANFNQ